MHLDIDTPCSAWSFSNLLGIVRGKGFSGIFRLGQPAQGEAKDEDSHAGGEKNAVTDHKINSLLNTGNMLGIPRAPRAELP